MCLQVRALQRAEAPILGVPPPTHDDNEADYASVIEEPAAGSEPTEQSAEPAPQEEAAAEDPKETKVKSQGPASIDRSLKESVASTEGRGKHAAQSAKPQDLS